MFERRTKRLNVLLGLLLTGVLSLFAASAMDPHGFWSRAFDHFGAALVVVGGIVIVEKMIEENHLLDEMRRIVGIKNACDTSGIESYRLLASPSTSCDEMIAGSTYLGMVFNDGKKWTSAHFDQLRLRFSKASSTTEMFVLDPDGSAAGIIANRNGDDVSRLREKITSAVADVVAQFKAAGSLGTLKVYLLQWQPVYTAIVFDDKAVVTLYTLSSGRRSVPEIVVADTGSKQGLFAYIHEDISVLRGQCKVHFDSNSNGSGTNGMKSVSTEHSTP